MARIVLLLVIGFVIYLALRGFLRAQARGDEKPHQDPKAKGEDMVACARCGVHLPRSEARTEAGIFYCQDNPRCRAP
ncbi:MAG TPA: PP0621 family protein [Usitatibacter sp.]